MTCPPLPTPLPQGARESFLVLKACHYEGKTSRAECEAACRNDRLSAGQVGRLGVTFKARRSNRAEYKIACTEWRRNLEYGTPMSPWTSFRVSKVKEIPKHVLDYWQVGRLNAALPRTSFAIASLLPKSAIRNDN